MRMMVIVTLRTAWIDATGTEHPPGAVVRIPEGQLDDLVTTGVVATDATDCWVTCD